MRNRKPHCASAIPEAAQRRRVIQLVAAGVAIGLGGIAGAHVHAQPAAGDRLVSDDAQGEPMAETVVVSGAATGIGSTGTPAYAGFSEQ